MFQVDIPYYNDSTLYYEKVRHLEWAVFIDSCYQGDREPNVLSRYDIVTAQPFIKVIDHEDGTQVFYHDENKIYNRDPSEVLKNEMMSFQLPESNLPFNGGAIGFSSYERNKISSKKNIIPKFVFGIYDWAIIVDHFSKKAFLVSAENDIKTDLIIREILDRINDPSINCKEKKFVCKDNLFKEDFYQHYKKNFNKVKKYLINGDCYQVNLSLKYKVETDGDSWVFYKKFRQINQSPFMAYMSYDDFALLSGSPERFINCQNGKVTTRPIKGTKPRGNNPKKDKINKQNLLNSDKDQSENLMIVDLLRNDLGINCETGSIKVDELFKLESYPNVYHLVSSISGKLRSDSNIYNLFCDAFPGGSITGAPKKRSMEIINDLESHSRDFYCGSVAFFSFDKKLDSNIAIRSMLHKDNTLHIYSGGGLTIASELDDEYEEIKDKLGNIKDTIKFFQE